MVVLPQMVMFNGVWGSGFRCKKVSQGTYIVEFDQPFNEMPAPVCTVFGPPWATFNLSTAIVDVTPSMFVCLTSTERMPQDSGFTFIVVGE